MMDVLHGFTLAIVVLVLFYILYRIREQDLLIERIHLISSQYLSVNDVNVLIDNAQKKNFKDIEVGEVPKQASETKKRVSFDPEVQVFS